MNAIRDGGRTSGVRRHAVANIYRRERRHHRLDETVRAIKFVGTSFACGEFASAINTVSGRCSVTNPDERPASSIDRKSKGSPSSEVQPTPRYARFVRTICGSTRAQIKASATRKSAAPIPEHLTDILERFPSLSRRIYSFCQHVTDVAELVGLLDRFVKTVKTATEDQLFWIAKMCEDYLQGMPLCSKLLLHVYEHPAATTIVQAKVLEIKELKSGFQDIREGHLKGSSDWRAWASIVGSTSMPKAKRNQMLKYVGKASRMNSIVAAAVMNE
jgi:hypothetical protein